MTAVRLVERRPTLEEYRRLISAVGWKARDAEAISRALDGSLRLRGPAPERSRDGPLAGPERRLTVADERRH
jgi:hypothetical protein